ncbi:hypothetical protein MTO96_030662 [Rhipicephalus appendiculatus]
MKMHLRRRFLMLSGYDADESDDTFDSSTSAVIPQGPDPPQATQDRPPADPSGSPDSEDLRRRSSRPQIPPLRLAYTHGFHQSETA